MNENHTFQTGWRNVLSIEVTTVRTVAQNNLCGNLHTRAGAVTAANAIDSVAQRKGSIEFAVAASPHNTPQPQGLVTARQHQVRAIWREPGRPHGHGALITCMEKKMAAFMQGTPRDGESGFGK